VTFSNALSKASGLSSTPTSRAMSMSRLKCSGLSGLGFGLRGIRGQLAILCRKINHPRLLVATFSARPAIESARGCSAPYRTARKSHSHRALSTKLTGIGRLFRENLFKSSDACFQGCNPFCEGKRAFAPSERTTQSVALDWSQHG
jgi:hypothetical protein